MACVGWSTPPRPRRYGERGSGATIGPKSLLIFKIELMKIYGKDEGEETKCAAESWARIGTPVIGLYL